MIAYCTQCGAALPSASAACLACAPAAGTPAAEPDQTGRGGWGFGPVALGIMALIPTALLMASLALVVSLPVATVISAAALGAVQLVLVWMLALRTWPPPWAAVGLRRPVLSYRSTALFVVAAFLGSLLFAQLYTMSATALGWTFLLPPELPGELLLPNGWAIFSVVALAIWTPVVEEIFFRAFVMRGLANRWGDAAAVVLSAALFAALHFTPALLLPVFVTGLLLGGLYWHTRSLWPCIAVHAAQNLVAVLTVMFGL